MRILGIDPGGTTGFCWIDIVGDGYNVFRSYEERDLWMFPCLSHAIVAMESCVATGQLTKGKMQQLKAIGAVEYTGVEINWVTPEERSRVKKIPKEVVGDHARDACRVAVAFALRKGLFNIDATDSVLTTD